RAGPHVGSTPGSSNTPHCRPAAMAGAWLQRWPAPRSVYGVCRCSIGWPRTATPSPTRCRRCGPWPRRFGRTSLFYLSGHGAGDGLWRFQDGQASEVWKGAEGGLAEPPAVSPDGRRVAVVVRRDGKKHLVIMSADGTDRRTLAASINVEGTASAGTADWSPDGTWIVTGGSDAQGSGLFKLPVAGGAPVRLAGAVQAINPVGSPDERLIVYAGPFVGGSVPLLGIRPDGALPQLPPVRSSVGGSYRFLPDGT